MIARLRRRDDDGFALLLVLFTITMVMIGVTTVLTVVTPNIAAAKKAEGAVAALAAARSGIDDAVAYLVSIPSCRSESRICPAALNADSTKITGWTSPSLGSGQSYSWKTAKVATADGFVRVTSTGAAFGVSRILVADLALRPSILAYGYYTDYESLSPEFLQRYYRARSIYLTDTAVYSNADSAGGGSLPRYANWAGTTNAANCAQHWYAEPGLGGRGANATSSQVTEPGRVGSTTTSNASDTSVVRTGGCDLVFSPAMVLDGKTFTRDAILSTSTGPKFNQPVYTMWGYNDGTKNYTTPAFTNAGQYYRLNDPRTDSAITGPNVPQIAQDDLILPKTIGQDGIPENACVYYGPTRVKLNGDGTATVTSPATRTRNPASQDTCYPTGDITASGVVGWQVDYSAIGGGAIVVRNLGTAPAAGWPTNPTRSTQIPAVGNQAFYLPSAGSTDVARHTNTSAANDGGCTGSVKYSATIGAACAWTNLTTATDSTAATGWTSYTNTTCATSGTNSTPSGTNRQRFECDYGKLAASAQPATNLAGGQYATLRTSVKAELAKGNCLAGAASAQATCVNNIVTAQFAAINSASARYVATTVAGTPVQATVTGNTASPVVNDPFFMQPTPASETATQTPLTTTVARQTYNTSKRTWTADAPAFTMTTTQSSYDYRPARGATYFPNPLDVTSYNTGVDSNNTPVGATTGTQPTTSRYPGDLYVDGVNKGKLSVVAENDVIVTGDITNPSGYTPATDAVSIAAGHNVRNYHPVQCVDQNATDINNTTPGWCPNDITGLTTAGNTLVSNNGYQAAHPAKQYTNLISPAADRTIEAAVFALSGSFGTDNYNRGDYVGKLDIHGGLYQAHRGGNGIVSGSLGLSGTTLRYTYVDLQRAQLPYVPPSTSGNDVRPWNVVSISAGCAPSGTTCPGSP